MRRTHASIRWLTGALLGAAACGLSALPARAAGINVTNLNDTGSGSLRAAIQFANVNAGTTVVFHIPAALAAGGVFTIKPNSALPALTASGTVIDGRTQTNYTGDTNPDGPEVEINGAQAPGANGLQ